MTLATFAAAQVLRALPRVQLSRAVGRLCEQQLSPQVSRILQQAYVRAWGVNMEEVEPRPTPYPCFDAFFTRRLRKGARCIDEASVVCPADGTVQATGPVDSSSRIIVKGQPYDVGELIGDHRDQARYTDGSFCVVYLSPRDYHRVHSPVDGDITVVRGLGGDLFPVNVIGERHISQLLVRNNRAVVGIDTAGLGRVTVVMVGAVIVGRITVNALPDVDDPKGVFSIRPPVPVVRGDEIGTFHLGSTTVLLLEPGVEITHLLGRVRYGQSLVKGP